jgi:S1-C subfamily serine protease
MKRILLLSFLGSCAFLGSAAASLWASRLLPPALAQGPAAGGLSAPTTDVVKLGDRFEAVARKVSPAVVAIDATKPAPPAPGNTVAKPSRPVEESGSGVLVRFEGRGVLVLTNNHVISQAAPGQITVSLADGRLFKPVQVLADPESDVALLRLEGADALPTAALGDSDTARVGQWVLAVGSPFGLDQTVTHGIISARERGQVSLGSTIRIKDFLQTDAAINPGSSGGPLVNLDGEVIGLNTAIASHSGSNSGVAFSIPVNLVKRVARQLVEKGNVSRGYLGMQLAASFEPADALKLGLDRVQGALVETVYPDTPAAAAGLVANDVVLQVDDVPVRNENHLINLITGTAPGQKVRLQVWRERRTAALEATVGDWSKNQGRFRPERP